MFNIEKYLQKFSKNIQSTESHKKQITEIIKKHTEIDLDIQNIEIKNYIIYIKSSSGVSNKIFIYKSKILEDILNSLSIKIVDIK